MSIPSPTRDALVIGICNYEYLNDHQDGRTDLNKVKKLTALAEQAGKLADLLDIQGGQGGFKVTRLPPPFTNPPAANLNGRVDLPDLEQAIIKLLSPPEESPTDTALLFFAGHGLVKEKEGFLATTEADGKNVYGFPLKKLRELLQKSSVKQLVVFLESCYSGELLTDFEKTFKDGSHDICFITSARAHEEALADGLLTQALLELLDYTNVKEYPEKYNYVTDKLLLERLQAKVRLMEGWQRPQWKPEIQKRSIVLTNVAYTQEELSDVVPYRGLDYFKTNSEDALFFKGRDQLIEELLNIVEKKHFLVVYGASGNGKSSVVRAGLLYQLPQRFPYRALPVITPGQTPVASLRAIVDEAKQIIDQTQRVVLTVDQFEEVFASAYTDSDRQAFVELLFNLVEDISRKFSVILVIRSDFLGKFLENSPDSVKNDLILVKPPEDNEVRQMIAEPAKRAGFSVEPHLVAEMVADFRKLEVGLPFLEFALTTLWERGKTGRLLKYEDYENSGKIAGILESEANKHYQSFSAEEQIVVQRIFLELTDLKGKSDTRRPVLYDHLLALPYPPERIEKVIHQLVEQRLITVDKPQDAPVVVNLAHETLIQHWSLFHDWLQEFREDATKQRRLEEDAQAYSDGKKSLLTDLDLGNAEAYLKVHQARVPLTEKAVQFIQASVVAREQEAREREQQRREKERLQRRNWRVLAVSFVVAVVLGSFGWWQWGEAGKQRDVATEQKVVAQQQRDEANQQRVNAELQASTLTAEKLLGSGDKLDALVETIKAGKQLQQAKRKDIKIKPEISNRVKVALHRSVYETREFNRIERPGVSSTNISFSPDGQFFASTYNGSLVIYRRDGTLFKEIKASVEDGAVAFSPDSKAVAVTLRNPQQRGTYLIQLWSVEGTLLKSFEGANGLQIFEGVTGEIKQIKFSPDGQNMMSYYLDTGSRVPEGAINIWHRDGHLLGTIILHLKPYLKPSAENELEKDGMGFDPTAKIILAVKEDTLNFWNLEGQLIKVVKKGGPAKVLRKSVLSADGKMVASIDGDGVVVIWNTEGEELKSNFKGEQKDAYISSLAFSPDNKIVATTSGNRIVLWKVDGTFIRTLGKHTCLFSGCQLEFSRDGQILASTSSSDATIKLWKIGNPLVYPPMIHTTGRITFSPGGQTLALIDKDKIIRLYNRDGRLLKMIEAYKEGASDVKFSPDGKTIISVGGSSVIGLRWREEMQYQFTKPQQDYDNAVAKIWDLDGKLVDTVDLWSKFIIRQGHDDNDPLVVATFKPDSKTVLSGGRRSFLWNLEEPYGSILSIAAPCGDKVMWDIKSNFNGEVIAVTCGEQVIIFEGNNPGHLLGSHQDIVWRVNFSPDGKKLVSASRDNTIKLWDLVKKKELFTLSLKSNNNVRSGAIGQRDASFSPDGQTILTAGETGFYLWDLTGKQLLPFTEDMAIDDDGFVGIGVVLEIEEQTKTPTVTKVYDNSPASKAGIKTDSRILEINGITTTGLILDDVLKLLSGEIGTQVTLLISSDDMCSTRSLLRDQIRSSHKLANSIYHSAQFSPDGRIIAVDGHEGLLELWSREGQLRKRFKKGHYSRFSNLSFSPDGKLLASIRNDNIAILWKVAEGQEFKTLKHNAMVRSVKFSPDGQLLATASADNIVRIWKTDGTLLKPLLGEARPIYNYFGADQVVGIAPDGKTLVLTSANETMTQTRDFHGRLFNVFGNESQREWFSPDGDLQVSLYNDNSYDVNKVVMSPNGKLLASFSKRVVYLYATDGSWGGKKLEGHSDEVSDVSFSLDGKSLVSIGASGTLKVWDIDGTNVDLRQSIQIPVSVRVAFGTDGLLAFNRTRGLLAHTLSYNMESSVELWNSDGSPLSTLDTSSTSELFKLADISDNDSYFPDEYGIIFTLDGETLVTDVNRTFSREEIGQEDSGRLLSTAYKIAFWNLNVDYLLKRGCDLISPFLKGENSLAQKERYLCTGIDYAGTLLLDEGDYLANTGNVEEAIAKFTEALQRNPKLHFDPGQRAQQLAVSFLVAEGEKLAGRNDVNGAIAKFRNALEWNPRLGFNAEEKARQLDEKSQQIKEQKFLEKVNQLNMGDKATTQEILNAYAEVLKSPRLQTEVLKRLEQMAEGLVGYKDKPHEAIPILEKIIETKSDHENAWSLMGNALFRQNKIDDATVAYEKQLAINPNHEMALKGLMSVFAAQQKLATEGLAFINKLVADNPQHPSAWYILGKILDGQRKYEEALVAFKKQVEVNPEHKGAWLARGQISLQLNNFDEVITAFNTLLSKFKEQCECDKNYVWYFFGFALEQQAKLLEQQGKLSEKQGKLDDARLAYNQVDFRNADYYLLAQERVVKLMSDIGPLWRERAIERLRQLLSYNLARISFGSDHKIPMGLTQLEIQLLLDSDRREDAMTVYNKMTRQVDSAIQQAENEFQSQSCVQSGNSPQNEECISNLKDWRDKKITDMLFRRVLLAGKVDDLKRIEQDSRHILKINSKHVDALYALGYTLANNTDRYQESLDLLERALELQPNHPIILSGIGWVLYKMDKSPKSLEYLRKAYAKMDASIPPGTVAETASHLGEVLWASGKKEEAKTIWKKALKDFPDNQPLREVAKKFWSEFEKE